MTQQTSVEGAHGGPSGGRSLWESISSAAKSAWRKLEGFLFLSFLKLICTVWVFLYPVLISLQLKPFTEKVGLWIALFVVAFGVSNIHRFEDKFSQWRTAFRQRDRLLLGYLEEVCRFVRARKERKLPALANAELQRIALQLLVTTTRILTDAPHSVDISANVMVLENGQLAIKTFDSTLHGRKKIALPVTAIGAGQAYRELEPVYIPDIRAPEYREHFDQTRPYRSIMSFPVIVDGTCSAVVNIDSTAPDFFASERLRDPLYPIVMLVGLSTEMP